MTTATMTLISDKPEQKIWEIGEHSVKVIPQGTIDCVTTRHQSQANLAVTYHVQVIITPVSGATQRFMIPVASPEAGLELIAKKLA